MINVPVGNLWLKQHFKLTKFNLTHHSFIGSRDKIEFNQDSKIVEIFGPKYDPKTANPILHVEFSLKYDDLNLEFLQAVFNNIDINEILLYVDANPSKKYVRQIGFFYEFLTGVQLVTNYTINTNYVNLLDNEKYITGKIVRNIKWRINDNLIGNSSYCPIIRKTKELNTLLDIDIKEQIEQLSKSYPTDIFQRATNYLYTKETRSSYEIEREKPSPERVQRFISLLTQAGEQPGNILMSESNLTKLQNAIVDPRFAAQGYRNFQNYISQSLPNSQELIHYVCPHPAYLIDIMNGLMATLEKTSGSFPIARATVVAFGFVFAHPFEDGNGRLQRFLIHDMLTRDGIVPKGLVIPVSAHMLTHMKEYDKALEAYSVPLMQHITYQKTPEGAITVTNPEEVEGYFRYPDLTAQTIYLAHTIQATIANDMTKELEFLLHYDEVKRELQLIVDMPDKDIDLMITFLHQNKGIFPKRRREYFNKLTDQEISAMVKSFNFVFEID